MVTPRRPAGASRALVTDRADRLADLRRRAEAARRFRQRQTAEAASAQAEEEFRYRISKQNVAPAQTEAPFKSIFGQGRLGQKIGSVIPDEIEKPMSEGLRFGYDVGFKVLPEIIYAGVTGATSPLGITGGEKAQRIRARLNEFSDDKTDEIYGKFSAQNMESLSNMFTDLKDIHEERGFWAQLGVGLFNPVEYAAGGLITKGVKSLSMGRKAAKIAKGAEPKVKSAASVVGDKVNVMIPVLQEKTEYLARAFPTYSLTKPSKEAATSNVKGKFDLREHYRNVKSFLHEHIGINALADPNNRAFQYRAVSDMMSANVNDNVVLLMNKINSRGDVRILFGLDEDFATTLGGKLKKRESFQSIAQNAGKKRIANKLNEEQKAWLHNFSEVTQSLKQYVIDKDALRAVDKDEWMFNKGIKGEYFPNFWSFFKTFDDKVVRLEKGAKVSKRVGAKGPDEHTRFYRDANDAFEKGYRGDPLEQVATLYQSLYKRVMDKELTDMARPWMKTMQERMGKSLDGLVTDNTKILKGLKDMQASGLGQILLQPGRKRLGQFKGRRAVGRSNPELIERMQEIRAMTKISEKRAAIKVLRKDMDEAIKKQSEVLKAAREKRADMAKRYGKRPGEISMPMSAFSGKIGTPRELIEDFGNLDFAVIAGKEGNLTAKEWSSLTKTINRTDTTGALTRIAEASQAAVRTLMTGFDLGLYGLHLLPMALTQPGKWRKVVGKSFQATIGGELNITLSGKFNFKKGNVLAKYIDDNWDTVVEMSNHGLAHGSMSDFVQGLGKGTVLRRGAAAKPFGIQIGKPFEKLLEGVERNFESGLSMAKVEMWKALKPMALAGKTTPQAQQDALRRLGTHIRKMTGTASMEEIGLTPGTQRAMGALLMFAPRYRLATYGLMKDVFKGNLQGTLARESIGRMAAAGLMYYSYLGHHLNQPAQLDPTSGRFLTYKIGDSHIGIGSAYVTMARFMGRFLNDSLEDPTAGFKIWDGDNVTQRFVRSQLAPLTGTGWDMLEGRDYIGEPTREDFGQVLKSAIGENIMPFWASGMLFDQPRAGFLSPPAEFLGMRTMPVGQWERFKLAFDSYAMAETGKSYDEMNKQERSDLIKLHPELEKMKEESFEVMALREKRDDVADYRERIRDAKEYRDDQMNELARRFNSGQMRGLRFRQERSQLGRTMAVEYDLAADQFPEVVEILKEEYQNPRAHLEDLAYNAYIQQIVEGDFYNEEVGEFDYAAKRAAEEGFEEEWGEANYSYVKKRLQSDYPLLQELDLGREAIGPYWEVGDIILERSGHGDLKTEYRKYLKERPNIQKQIELTYPMFKEVKAAQSKAREAMRIKNAQLEQFLYRWDYIQSFKNPDNIMEFNTFEAQEQLKARPIWFTVPNYEQE